MTASKIVAAAASGAGSGATLDVDNVFNTQLYTGTYDAVTQTFNTGQDLLNEGGMIWFKARTHAQAARIIDTERGTNASLIPSSTNASGGLGADGVSFLSNGFSVGWTGGDLDQTYDYAAWSFRKAPKFFDCIQYSGNSTAGRTISHNLGCTVGQVWVKRTSHTNNWICWHRGIANNKYLQLNSTSQAYADGGIFWNNTTPSSTTVTLGSDSAVNATGSTYVMYVFAHNDGDGEFGPDSDQDIIKCGSYTGNGTVGNAVTLGFEPQWIMIKNADRGEAWYMYDVMRGIATGGNDSIIYANASDAELDAGDSVDVTSTGFSIKRGQQFFINYTGDNYIYMAIRRGPLAVPEAGDATKVFKVDQGHASNVPNFESGFPVDFGLLRQTSSDSFKASARLTSGKYLETSSTAAESSNSNYSFDYQDGWVGSAFGTSYYSWMWKRAPSFCDITCFTGNGGGTRTISHHLQTAPKMLWLKRRDGSSPYGDWYVQHTGIPANQYLNLNTSTALVTSPDAWNSTYAAADVFTVGSDNNVSNFKYFVVLFGEIAGISKLGSYTGNGTSQTIDCGFSNGARFVLIKQTDTSGANWFVFDSERGIVSGNDSALRLNTTDADVTNEDAIDPVSSGFSVTNSNGYIDTNNSGGSYIFYAIA